MIREFWVENFMSIKDRQTLNFESKSKEDDCLCATINNIKINKLIVLYGANASGKSNLIVAMQDVFELLLFHRNDRNDKIRRQYNPFATNKDEPTKAYVSFFINDIRYDYYLTYNNEYILNENLYYYPLRSRALFYSREFKSRESQADIKFGGSVNLKKETINTIISNTLNNHSVLSTFGKVSLGDDSEPISRIYNWVKDYVHEINGDKTVHIVPDMKEVNNDPKLRDFYLKMLKKADFNINNFSIIKTVRDLPDPERKLLESSSEFTPEEKNRILNEPVEDLMFSSSASDYDFNLSWIYQSAGTLKYIKRLRILYNLTHGDHIYFIDELEMNLHYDLLLFYLNVFLFNSNKSQLIITTQEAALLKEDMLNAHRDSVFFVEKSYDTASSSFTRADEYGLHKNMSLYNSYITGRLGAKPEFGSYLLDEE